MTDRTQEAIRHVLSSADYAKAFAAWIFHSWKIYLEFERMSLYGVKQGRARLSAKFLCEQIRWNTALSEDGAYEIDNCRTADLSRLVCHFNPVMRDRFEFRRRTKVAA